MAAHTIVAAHHCNHLLGIYLAWRASPFCYLLEGILVRCNSSPKSRFKVWPSVLALDGSCGASTHPVQLWRRAWRLIGGRLLRVIASCIERNGARLDGRHECLRPPSRHRCWQDGSQHDISPHSPSHARKLASLRQVVEGLPARLSTTQPL